MEPFSVTLGTEDFPVPKKALSMIMADWAP